MDWQFNSELHFWIKGFSSQYFPQLEFDIQYSIQNCNFELNCQSNAENSSWNFIFNQMISWDSVALNFYMGRQNISVDQWVVALIDYALLTHSQ